MALKDLVGAVVSDPVLRREFAKNAGAVIARYALSKEESQLVREGDKAKIAKTVGPELMEAYVRLASGDLHVLYPGVAVLEIMQVEILRDPLDKLLCTLVVDFTWDEHLIPRFGLPSWAQVYVYDPAHKEFLGDRPESFVVPELLDVIRARGRASRRVKFPSAGRYEVTVDASGSQEVMPSKAYDIAV